MAYLVRMRVRDNPRPYPAGGDPSPSVSLVEALEAGLLQGMPSALLWLRRNVSWVEGVDEAETEKMD